ncbi:MAG TPA: T9SS type A sorting domain-containing protein [Ignavibacteria bacterium]|nr:T9SS type A sorting domain-containing protein [Ignavibacteria bacterium]
MKTFYKLLILFILLSSMLKANIINVPGSYGTIQAGINASSNGDTVLVEPGTYFENIIFGGKKIVLTSRFYIAGNLTFINTTIINGSTPSHPDSASCVRIFQGEDSTTVLQGFTITGGKGTKWQDEHGAGRYTEGGGILTAHTSPTIRFCVIKDNEAAIGTGVVSTGGGGIRCGDGNPKILNCIIMNNTGRYGAGIVLNYTGATIKNCVITKNYGSNSYGAGAALWINNNNGTLPKIIENNTIVNNSATTAGTGGIYSNTPTTFIRNCIVWGNTGPGAAYSGTMNFSYTNINATVAGMGNINTAPQFDSANFILGTGSPCIDAGDTAVIYNDKQGAPGFALYPSRGTTRNDMGAYGGQLAAILLSNTFVSVQKISNVVPERFELKQNYPNPFNPTTNFEFRIANFGFVSLKVYDITGKVVADLVSENLHPGQYSFNWNAERLSSGIYFYKLTADNFSDVKKMTLLK